MNVPFLVFGVGFLVLAAVALFWALTDRELAADAEYDALRAAPATVIRIDTPAPSPALRAAQARLRGRA